MANSIAFSVGSGGGGSAIKSIQRGESPIMKLSLRYSLVGYHPSEPGTSESYKISEYVSLDPYTVEINQVNPNKSIILLDSPNTSWTISTAVTKFLPGIIIKSFTQTSFQLYAGFDRNYLKNFETAINKDDIVFYSDAERGGQNEIIISNYIFPIANTNDITAYLLNNGRNPIIEGIVGPGNTDADEIITMNSLATVSWQVIEFY